MSLSNNIKFLRERHGLTQVDLAEIVGVTDKAVSTWENGTYQPRMGVIEKLSKHFNIPKSDLLDKDLEYDVQYAEKNTSESNSIESLRKYGIFPIETKKIPLLGEVICGEPRFAEKDFECYVECGVDIHADFALRAVGDSMVNARIHDGDIVFVRQQPTVNNGEIAVVLIGEETTLKRFRRIGNTVILSPENPAYDDIIIKLDEMTEVRILGKAVAFQSDVR